MLSSGGVIAYPTDSYYAYGCAISSVKAIAAIKSIKGKDSDDLSLVCSSMSMATDYAKIDNWHYKFLKEYTPGALTAILLPSSSLPNKFMESKKSVGIRITSNSVARAIVEMLGEPLVCSSIVPGSLEPEDRGCASLIEDEVASKVALFVDGGDVVALPTTVVDLRRGEVEVVREGQIEF